MNSLYQNVENALLSSSFAVFDNQLRRTLKLHCLDIAMIKHVDDSVRGVAGGGAMGAIAPPPIPKAVLTIFRLIKLLMCEPNKYVSADQQNCLKIYSTSAFS